MHRLMLPVAAGASAFVLLAGSAAAGYAMHRPHEVTRTVTVTKTAPKVIIRTVYKTRTRTVVAPASTPAYPPIPHINGATWAMLINCTDMQCTAVPGAGPFGSTCGQVVNGEQFCAGSGTP